jgi:hypothetical protein
MNPLDSPPPLPAGTAAGSAPAGRGGGTLVALPPRLPLPPTPQPHADAVSPAASPPKTSATFADRRAALVGGTDRSGRHFSDARLLKLNGETSIPRVPCSYQKTDKQLLLATLHIATSSSQNFGRDSFIIVSQGGLCSATVPFSLLVFFWPASFHRPCYFFPAIAGSCPHFIQTYHR